jgi:hypothetical protein
MFQSAHIYVRASTATIIATMSLTVSSAIAGASTVNAQWADRETATQMINAGSQVAMSPAGPTASMTATVGDATASQSAQAGKDGTPNKKALVGSWVETVTFPPESGRPQLKSLASFHDDGTMVCSDQGAVTTEPPAAAVFTSCHGVWTHLEQRTFAYTVLELISDLTGNLVGYLKVRGSYTVSQSGNEYTGISFAQVLDADGSVLYAVEVINAGQRIHVELP